MERLDSILTEQKRLADEQTKLVIILDRLTNQVEYHIKRSDILEDSFAVMRAEIEPVKQHVILMNTLAKVIIGVAALAYTVLKITRLF